MTFELTKYIATTYQFCDFEIIPDGFLFVVRREDIVVGKVITSRRQNLILFDSKLFRLDRKNKLTNEDNSSIVAIIQTRKFRRSDECKLRFDNTEYIFRRERSGVKFNLLKYDTWNHNRFSISGPQTEVNYFFRLNFREAPALSTPNDCPFTGSVEMEEKDLFLSLIGLFAVQNNLSDRNVD